MQLFFKKVNFIFVLLVCALNALVSEAGPNDTCGAKSAATRFIDRFIARRPLDIIDPRGIKALFESEAYKRGVPNVRIKELLKIIDFEKIEKIYLRDGHFIGRKAVINALGGLLNPQLASKRRAIRILRQHEISPMGIERIGIDKIPENLSYARELSEFHNGVLGQYKRLSRVRLNEEIIKTVEISSRETRQASLRKIAQVADDADMNMRRIFAERTVRKPDLVISTRVKIKVKQIEQGAVDIVVASKKEAEELLEAFLRKSEIDTPLIQNMYIDTGVGLRHSDRKILLGSNSNRTFHWDNQFELIDDMWHLEGHGPKNAHDMYPHLQFEDEYGREIIVKWNRPKKRRGPNYIPLGSSQINY